MVESPRENKKWTTRRQLLIQFSLRATARMKGCHLHYTQHNGSWKRQDSERAVVVWLLWVESFLLSLFLVLRLCRRRKEGDCTIPSCTSFLLSC